MNLVFLILIGLVVGLLGGLLGIDAVVIIPALVLMLGYSQYQAHETQKFNLSEYICPTTLL